MKNLIILCVLFMGYNSYSQKCKYQRNEIDEFTKSTVIITKYKALTKVGLGFGAYILAQAKSINGSKSIVVFISEPDIFTLNKGDSVMFKTKKGEIIKATFAETKVADVVFSTQYSTTRWHAKSGLVLDGKTYYKLMESEIVKVRWYTSQGYIEREAKKKQYKNLSNLLKCIE